jgi:hypothetical protein
MNANQIPLLRVQSNSIAAIGYHANSGTLVVSFVSGGKYTYAAVPHSVAIGFFTPAQTESDNGDVVFAPRSIGRYYHAQVRGKYTSVRLEAPDQVSLIAN